MSKVARVAVQATGWHNEDDDPQDRQTDSPAASPSQDDEGETSNSSSTLRNGRSSSEAEGSNHIRLESPKRPDLYKRNTLRGQSTKSLKDALRMERSREEQQTLLGVEEEADDDGCYPPRINDEPRAPNPHGCLPVYATIHKIRRLVIASIGGTTSIRHVRRMVG